MSRLYIYHSVKMRIEFLHVVHPYMYFYWFEQIGSKLFFFPGFEFITWKILINIKYILNIGIEFYQDCLLQIASVKPKYFSNYQYFSDLLPVF